MKIETLNIADIRASSFNPRITLEKGSREYEAIADSIREFGFVEPLVVNSHNMCCLGGHQRLSVLKDMGVESVECVMVEEPDQAREKALCVALNRIKGEWDMDMLAALLQDKAVFSLPTGFEEGEVDLERMLEDVEPPELPEDEPEEAEEPSGPEGTTVVKIGNFKFKITISEYQSMLNTIRDAGIFDSKAISDEIKRRILNG